MNNITVQQIECFLTVANCHSISSAAKILYISQPALSNRLIFMEDALGVKLFNRTNRGVEMTEEGLKLYADLDLVYNKFRVSLNNMINQRINVGKKVLSVGFLHMSDVIAAAELTCSAFKNAHPDVKVIYDFYSFSELSSRLICGELEAAFTLSFEAVHNDYLEYCDVCPITSYFYLPARWNIHTLDDGSRRFLETKPLLLELNGCRNVSTEQCRANGFEPKQIKYVSSFLTLANMVRDGEGFAISGSNIPVNEEHRDDVVRLPMTGGSSAGMVQQILAWRKGCDKPYIRDLVSVIGKTDYKKLRLCSASATPKTRWYSSETTYDSNLSI